MSMASRCLQVGLLLLASQAPALKSAPVSWNTNSSGNWNVAGNWSPGLPTTADDVTINRPAGSPTVSLVGTDNITIRSLANAEILTTAGGQLTLTNGASTSTGTFNHNGITSDTGYLNVTGAGTTFTATGTVSLGGGSLYSNSGGVITMTGATAASGSSSQETQFWAQGAGSVLDLNNVTSLTGGANGWALYVLAEGGGLVDLDSVGTISTGRTYIEARAGSTIDLTALTTWSNGGTNMGLWARGGTIQTPNLTSAANIFFAVDGAGSLDAADVNSANGCSFYTDLGGQLTMPALTSYTAGSTFEAQIISRGASSKTNLTNVTSLAGGTTGWRLWALAETGGFIDLNSVPTISSGSVQFEARTGSTIDLAALTSFTRTPSGNAASGLWARGGTILTPNLTTASNIYFTVDAGGTIDTADVNSANACSFYTAGGGQLAMPALTSYAASGQFEAQIWSQGASSKTDLTNVTSLAGGTSGWRLWAMAETGGFIDLNSVPTISSGAVQFEARTGSTIDLAALTSFTRTPTGNTGSGLWARGGTILTPNLTTASNIYFNVDAGGTIDTADVNSANACSFYTTGGGQLAMPALTSYSASGQFEAQIWSQGASSKTDLTNVTSLAGGTSGWRLWAMAETGGFIDLNSVPTISNGSVQFEARTGSTIDLSALTSFTRTPSGNAASGLWARGGTILTPNLTTANSVYFQVSGAGVLDTADVTSANACSFYADTAGNLTMPALATYTGTSQFAAQFNPNGTGSQVNLPVLTTINGSTSGWTIQAWAQSGGVLNMNALTSIASGGVDLRADGAGSVINATSLATFNSTTNNSYVRAQTGGVINFKPTATTTFTGVNLELSPTGTINVGTAVLGASSRLSGTGTLAGSLNNTGGLIDPNSNSVGTQTIDGDFTQGAAGSLTLNVQGLAAGTQFDVLNVNGDATLAGNVTIVRSTGFTPAFGDTFRILNADSVADCFTGLTNYANTGTAHLLFALIYSPTAVDLKVVLGGDANGDGMVTGADYTIFADHYDEMCVGYANGDFNSDGIVSGADYTVWADNYGATAPPPSMAVPEPAGWALAAAALAGVVLARRRNRA